eukprot:31577_5
MFELYPTLCSSGMPRPFVPGRIAVPIRLAVPGGPMDEEPGRICPDVGGPPERDEGRITPPGAAPAAPPPLPTALEGLIIPPLDDGRSISVLHFFCFLCNWDSLFYSKQL